MSNVGRNRKHWKIIIDNRVYLSTTSSIDDAVFGACRRHEFDTKDAWELYLNPASTLEHWKTFTINVQPLLRPKNMSFAEFKRNIEGKIRL